MSFKKSIQTYFNSSKNRALAFFSAIALTVLTLTSLVSYQINQNRELAAASENILILPTQSVDMTIHYDNGGDEDYTSQSAQIFTIIDNRLEIVPGSIRDTYGGTWNPATAQWEGGDSFCVDDTNTSIVSSQTSLVQSNFTQITYIPRTATVPAPATGLCTSGDGQAPAARQSYTAGDATTNIPEANVAIFDADNPNTWRGKLTFRVRLREDAMSSREVTSGTVINNSGGSVAYNLNGTTPQGGYGITGEFYMFINNSYTRVGNPSAAIQITGTPLSPASVTNGACLNEPVTIGNSATCEWDLVGTDDYYFPTDFSVGTDGADTVGEEACTLDNVARTLSCVIPTTGAPEGNDNPVQIVGDNQDTQLPEATLDLVKPTAELLMNNIGEAFCFDQVKSIKGIVEKPNFATCDFTLENLSPEYSYTIPDVLAVQLDEADQMTNPENCSVTQLGNEELGFRDILRCVDVPTANSTPDPNNPEDVLFGFNNVTPVDKGDVEIVYPELTISDIVSVQCIPGQSTANPVVLGFTTDCTVNLASGTNNYTLPSDFSLLLSDSDPALNPTPTVCVDQNNQPLGGTYVSGSFTCYSVNTTESADNAEVALNNGGVTDAFTSLDYNVDKGDVYLSPNLTPLEATDVTGVVCSPENYQIDPANPQAVTCEVTISDPTKTGTAVVTLDDGNGNELTCNAEFTGGSTTASCEVIPTAPGTYTGNVGVSGTPVPNVQDEVVVTPKPIEPSDLPDALESFVCNPNNQFVNGTINCEGKLKAGYTEPDGSDVLLAAVKSLGAGGTVCSFSSEVDFSCSDVNVGPTVGLFTVGLWPTNNGTQPGFETGYIDTPENVNVTKIPIEQRPNPSEWLESIICDPNPAFTNGYSECTITIDPMFQKPVDGTLEIKLEDSLGNEAICTFASTSQTQATCESLLTGPTTGSFNVLTTHNKAAEPFADTGYNLQLVDMSIDDPSNPLPVDYIESITCVEGDVVIAETTTDCTGVLAPGYVAPTNGEDLYLQIGNGDPIVCTFTSQTTFECQDVPTGSILGDSVPVNVGTYAPTKVLPATLPSTDETVEVLDNTSIPFEPVYLIPAGNVTYNPPKEEAVRFGDEDLVITTKLTEDQDGNGTQEDVDIAECTVRVRVYSDGNDGAYDPSTNPNGWMNLPTTIDANGDCSATLPSTDQFQPLWDIEIRATDVNGQKWGTDPSYFMKYGAIAIVETQWQTCAEDAAGNLVCG